MVTLKLFDESLLKTARTIKNKIKRPPVATRENEIFETVPTKDVPLVTYAKTGLAHIQNPTAKKNKYFLITKFNKIRKRPKPSLYVQPLKDLHSTPYNKRLSPRGQSFLQIYFSPFRIFRR